MSAQTCDCWICRNRNEYHSLSAKATEKEREMLSAMFVRMACAEMDLAILEDKFRCVKAALRRKEEKDVRANV